MTRRMVVVLTIDIDENRAPITAEAMREAWREISSTTVDGLTIVDVECTELER